LFVCLFGFGNGGRQFRVPGQEIVATRQRDQTEGVTHEFDVVSRPSGGNRQFQHAREQPERHLAGPQRAFGILDEMPENPPHGRVDEQAIPIDVKQGRDADASEEQLPAREFLDVIQLAHGGLGMAQQLQGRRRTPVTGDLRDHLLDRGPVPEDADRGNRVESQPDVATVIFQKCQSPECVPPARLAPHRNPGQVFHAGEFARHPLAIPANERRELARPLVFPPRLHFENLRLRNPKERAVEWQIAEKIRLAVFHRDQKGPRLDAAQGFLQRAPMPNQVANPVGADGPGPEHQPPPAAFEQRQQLAQEAVRLPRILQMQATAQRVPHVVAVAFPDPQDDAAHLLKGIQHVR